MSTCGSRIHAGKVRVRRGGVEPAVRADASGCARHDPSPRKRDILRFVPTRPSPLTHMTYILFPHHLLNSLYQFMIKVVGQMMMIREHGSVWQGEPGLGNPCFRLIQHRATACSVFPSPISCARTQPNCPGLRKPQTQRRMKRTPSTW